MWKDLTLEQKSDLMKLYVLNGITDLDKIINHYNKFEAGGNMNSTKGGRFKKYLGGGPVVNSFEDGGEELKQFNTGIDWVKNYYSSPGFKQLYDITNKTYFNNNLDNELPDLNIQDIIIDEEGDNAYYNPNTKIIGLNPNTRVSFGLYQTGAHEAGHALDNTISKTGFSYSNGIPLFENSSAWKATREKLGKVFELYPELYYEGNHDAVPSESYADLIALKAALAERGIYDATLQDQVFTQEHLDKLRERLDKEHSEMKITPFEESNASIMERAMLKDAEGIPGFYEEVLNDYNEAKQEYEKREKDRINKANVPHFLKYFNDEDIIKAMNTIAQTNNEKKSNNRYAALGGKLYRNGGPEGTNNPFEYARNLYTTNTMSSDFARELNDSVMARNFAFAPESIAYAIGTESGYNVNAKNPKSSARGILQLTKPTLLQMYGAKQGEAVYNQYVNNVRSQTNLISDAMRYIAKIESNIKTDRDKMTAGRFKTNLFAPNSTMTSKMSEAAWNSLTKEQKQNLTKGKATYWDFAKAYDDLFSKFLTDYEKLKPTIKKKNKKK